LKDRKIIGCRKNILSIFVALLTFYKFIIKKKKEESDLSKNQCYFFFTNGYLSLKFENFAVLSKNIHYYFEKQFLGPNRKVVADRAGTNVRK
jgi:hypothetical protein